MRSRVVGLSCLAVVLAAQSALAQPDPAGEPAPPPEPDPTTTAPPPAPPPPPPPTTSTAPDVAPAARTVGTILPNMLPTRLGATIDIRADYTQSGEGGLLGDGDLFLLGFVAHAQYIWPQGYGAYFQMPYFYASDEESEQGLGNLEAGGLYRMPSGPSSELLLRGGIALDSAGQLDSLLSVFAQIGPRLYDAYPAGLLSNWLRGEASFRHAAGSLRLGASAGIDVPFGGDDDINLNIDALAKFALSAGFDEGNVGFALGFVMLQAIGTDSDDDNILGLNAQVSFPINPATALYGSFGWPDLEDNDELDVWAVGAGVRAAIN